MMNEQIEHCLYESGLTADGCWNQLDDYAKESIERFAKLIVRECCNMVNDEVECVNHFDNQHPVIARMKEHFGVE